MIPTCALKAGTTWEGFGSTHLTHYPKMALHN